MILDLKGFFVDKQFQVREMGCVSDNHEHDRYAFHPKTPYSELSDKDQRTGRTRTAVARCTPSG